MCAMKQEEEKTAKKEYHSPSLREYGNIREITKVVGQTGMKDGAIGKIKRTRP
jgi:hypothetical protein